MARPGALAVTAALLFGAAFGTGAVGATTMTPPPGNKFPLPDVVPSAPRSAVPSVVLGTLSVRVLQGTPGGPVVTDGHVKAVFVHRGTGVHRVEADVDQFGVAVFESIPVDPPVVPYVLLERHGAVYEGVGEMMDLAHPEQRLDVTCYEPTTDAPDWHLAMRHLMVERDPSGLSVTEVVVVSCPGDRTWTGTSVADGRPTTVAIELPRGAQDVSLVRGFQGWESTSFAGGTLRNHLPLVPGTSELQFRYILPVGPEGSTMSVVAPRRTDQLMVVMPRDLVAGPVDGLQPVGTEAMGGVDFAAYQASTLPEGAAVRVPVGGIAAATAPGDRSMLKTVVGIATGAALLFTIAVIFSRPKSAESAP